eukprot:m.213545 g.213545  ORF g.213545 m.213545 type:complete len:534 (+) comp33152_c0_seq2:313-1914(+)
MGGFSPSKLLRSDSNTPFSLQAISRLGPNERTVKALIVALLITSLGVGQLITQKIDVKSVRRLAPNQDENATFFDEVQQSPVDAEFSAAHQTYLVLGISVIVCLCLLIVQMIGWTSSLVSSAQSKSFRKFALVYIPAYLLATFADWMLGPWVYAVYQFWGYDTVGISELYIIGFAASLVLGTLVGPLADKFGRKRAAIAYCVIMIISCLCKNSGSFNVLAIGRVCGGLGTSLLYTAFESWAVFAFAKVGLPDRDRSRLFSIATFGNALSAIIAGLTSHGVATTYGPVGPFNAAIVVLVLCSVVISFNWEENYGSTGASMSVASTLATSITEICSSFQVLIAGAVSAVFEAVLYVFVFIWTPSLIARAGNGGPVPMGLVFACYMVAKMCGATVFSQIENSMSAEAGLRFVLGIAAVALAVPVYYQGYTGTLVAHCLFEFSVGMYWPAICTYRSVYISEATRATTMSLFRVPLNVFVCFCLLNIDVHNDVVVYASCAIALGSTLVPLTLAGRNRKVSEGHILEEFMEMTSITHDT